MLTGYSVCGHQDNQQPGFAMLGMGNSIRRLTLHPARGSRRTANCLDVRAYRTGRPLGGGLACRELWHTVDLHQPAQSEGIFSSLKIIARSSAVSASSGSLTFPTSRRQVSRHQEDGSSNRRRDEDAGKKFLGGTTTVEFIGHAYLLNVI
jgi:hypothetical protein